MLNNFFNQLSLSDDALRLKEEILSIPLTYEVISDHSYGLDLDELAFFHDLALENPRRAIPLLKKQITMFPECKPLWNYLHLSYTSLGQRRQANATLKEMTQKHPDYLFGRVALCENALEDNKLDQAVSHLGPDLDVRRLYPDRSFFHVSELFHYYLLVARILARRGEIQLAMGVKKAVETIKPSPEATELLEKEIMLATIKGLSEKLQTRGQNQIAVKIEPLTFPQGSIEAPVFHHQAMEMLYDLPWRLHDDEIAKILALPRDTMVEDLLTIVRDCTARGSLFYKNKGKKDAQYAAFHAIHFLAEVNAMCEVQDILAFFSLHPDVLHFCYIDELSCHLQIARLITHDLPTCFAWLRTPGIHSKGKMVIIDAITWIALSNPHHREFINSELAALLAFLLDSPQEDNVLDSNLTAVVIHSLITLRAKEHLPLIHRADEKHLFDNTLSGSIENIENYIREPMETAAPWLGIYDQYDAYEAKDHPGDDEEDACVDPLDHLLTLPSRTAPNTLMDSLLPPKVPAKASFTPPASRNSPCPCGSGKKYKKCCAL